MPWLYETPMSFFLASARLDAIIMASQQGGADHGENERCWKHEPNCDDHAPVLKNPGVGDVPIGTPMGIEHRRRVQYPATAGQALFRKGGGPVTNMVDCIGGLHF